MPQRPRHCDRKEVRRPARGKGCYARAFLIQKMKDLKGAAGSLLFLYKGVSLC